MPAYAIVLTTPLEVCLARQLDRAGAAPGARWGRRVPGLEVRRQYRRIEADLPGLATEGFDAVFTLNHRPPGDLSQAHTALTR